MRFDGLGHTYRLKYTFETTKKEADQKGRGEREGRQPHLQRHAIAFTIDPDSARISEFQPTPSQLVKIKRPTHPFFFDY
jgi:hypothetical protein